MSSFSNWFWPLLKVIWRHQKQINYCTHPIPQKRTLTFQNFWLLNYIYAAHDRSMSPSPFTDIHISTLSFFRLYFVTDLNVMKIMFECFSLLRAFCKDIFVPQLAQSTFERETEWTAKLERRKLKLLSSTSQVSYSISTR